MKLVHAIALCALVTLACSAQATSTPEPAPDPVALVMAKDENADPNVIEVNLEASEGMKAYGAAPPTPVWNYSGSIPGPFVDAKVGDRLIINFKNALPEETTIHWHGVRVPATMDGSLAMQSPVPPGGTFRYEFTLKDPGLFWYHPHVRGAIQVQRGLYGAIRVQGPNEPQADDEKVLMLDDIRLREDGTISEYLDDTSKMMGREGKTLLVNGAANATLTVRAGASLRLRLVNVANGRFFNLRLPGHTWRVIGVDGGLLPKPYDTETLLISPGERYDVMIIATGAPASEIELLDEPYNRGHEAAAPEPLSVARVRFTDDAPLAGRTLPDAFPAIERLPAASKTVPIVLDEATRNGELVFTVNDQVYPDVTPIVVERGGVRILEVKNESEMDHPFHLHGFFFQVLEKNGVAPPLDSTGRHHPRATKEHVETRRTLRRARDVDVPLPHPRAR